MLLHKLFVFIFVISFFCCFLPAEGPPSGFILEATKLQPYTPGFIGNGHFSLVTTPLGIIDAHSYMAWVYDHGPDDVPRIAVLPAWNGIDIKTADVWLSKISPAENTIAAYRQQINMFDGTLDTSYHWKSGENTTELQIQAFVSRANPNLAGIKLTIIPRNRGVIELSFSLRDWPSPKRLPLEKLDKIEPDPPGSYPSVWYPGNMVPKDRKAEASARGGKAWMISTAEGRETNVAQVMEVRWPFDLKNITTRTENDENTAAVLLRFNAENKPYTFYKFVGIASSQNKREPFKVASGAIDSIRSRSYDALLSEHLRAWHELWKTDIQIEGNDELQKMIHSMMFYLLCSIAKDTDFSIPPMGLSSDGYYGHIFWDADTWMFPPLLVMHPEIAKSIVMFRHRTMNAAQHKAKDLGFRGAMYPWEADEIGNETTPQFAYQNALSEIHVIGDVALAQWQYYLATADKQWLKDVGFPVLQQTAEFWTSRIKFNQQQNRYEIDRVVSVNEGLIGIHNDTYTNAVAKKNLELAVAAQRVLRIPENADWKKIAAGMFLPYNDAKSFHMEYENAPDSALGSVVPLLSYPLEIPMSQEAKRNNLSHAIKRLDTEEGPGGMMTITLLPLIAAELENKEWFNKLFPFTYQGFLRPPFYALAETGSNRSTNFLTGAGGFLQQVIFGYTGLRLTEDGLIRKFKPMLPASVKKLKLKNFKVRDKTFNYEVP
ncbi:hypothetical protein L0156_10615 [bacterium]|nr:hypothetical protein [bacterium]